MCAMKRFPLVALDRSDAILITQLRARSVTAAFAVA